MWKPKTMYAYVDGKLLCDVVDEALRLNMMASRLKQRIIEKNVGHKVEFKVEEVKEK